MGKSFCCFASRRAVKNGCRGCRIKVCQEESNLPELAKSTDQIARKKEKRKKKSAKPEQKMQNPLKLHDLKSAQKRNQQRAAV